MVLEQSQSSLDILGTNEGTGSGGSLAIIRLEAFEMELALTWECIDLDVASLIAVVNRCHILYQITEGLLSEVTVLAALITKILVFMRVILAMRVPCQLKIQETSKDRLFHYLQLLL